MAHHNLLVHLHPHLEVLMVLGVLMVLEAQEVLMALVVLDQEDLVEWILELFCQHLLLPHHHKSTQDSSSTNK